MLRLDSIGRFSGAAIDQNASTNQQFRDAALRQDGHDKNNRTPPKGRPDWSLIVAELAKNSQQ